MVKFNHLLPPFDNVKMRQAVLAVADQTDYLTALAGDKANWQPCPSFFTCVGTSANTAGSEALTGKRDYDKAKALVAEAGYKGEKIVILDAVDQPVAHSQALVVADELKKLGLNIEVQSMDWGTLVTRRAIKEPLDKGGWNIFATGWVGTDLLDPAENPTLRTNGEKGHFGWPTDAKIEELRTQWIKAAAPDERKKLAEAIQLRAFEVVPYIPTGQWVPKTAFRKNLKGVITAPPFLMWNVEKV
jgi:peptide/nickel transport system substrate-binding protein